MKNIVVTGCAGFIGSHLSEKLLAEGNRVIGIDNFDPFYPKEVKERNLKSVKEYSNFQFFEADLVDFNALEKLFSDIEKPDIVVHLAAKAGVRPSIEDPQGYIDNNISATRNVLELMRKQSVTKLVFASSSSVYGNMPEIPYHEEMDVSNPISPYAFTKKSCELLNHTYHHLYNIDIVNLRFFTVYGPRQRPDLAIHKFTRFVNEGKPITMYGDGSTSRDYTFIEDIIQGVEKSIDFVLNRANVFETMNLGNNEPVVLKDLIQMIYEVNGKEPTITRLPMQQGDVDRTFASIEKAKKLLGYQPYTSMKEGLQKFTEWYKENH